MPQFIFPYLNLVVDDAVFEGRKLKHGFVVNGHWEIYRNGDKWEARCPYTSRVVTRVNINPQHYDCIRCPSEYYGDYNAALDWAQEEMKKPAKINDEAESEIEELVFQEPEKYETDHIEEFVGLSFFQWPPFLRK